MKSVIVLLLLLATLKAETKLGETRLGFEFTPYTSENYEVPYNFKFKQKALLDDNMVQLKIYRRHYILLDKTFNRLKVWPRIKTPYFLFYEGMYDFYSGDRTDKKYNTILGSWYHFNKYIELKIGYSWVYKIKDKKTKYNNYVCILSGQLSNIKQHHFSYESYNFKSTNKNDYEFNMELQYKFNVTDDIDLYLNSIHQYKSQQHIYNNKLDCGVYWYF